MIERMRGDFVTEARAFARGMFLPTNSPALADSIVKGMAKADPEVAIPELQGLDAWGRGRQAAAVAALSTPVGLLVAGDKETPAFFRSGRGAVLLVGIERMPDAGHFLMLEDPDGFNARLRTLLTAAEAGARTAVVFPARPAHPAIGAGHGRTDSSDRGERYRGATGR